MSHPTVQCANRERPSLFRDSILNRLSMMKALKKQQLWQNRFLLSFFLSSIWMGMMLWASASLISRITSISVPALMASSVACSWSIAD